MTYFKSVDMSCVSNSLSLHVNLYAPVVATRNANAANEADDRASVCQPTKINTPLMGDVKLVT